MQHLLFRIIYSVYLIDSFWKNLNSNPDFVLTKHYNFYCSIVDSTSNTIRISFKPAIGSAMFVLPDFQNCSTLYHSIVLPNRETEY